METADIKNGEDLTKAITKALEPYKDELLKSYGFDVTFTLTNGNSVTISRNHFAPSSYCSSLTGTGVV